MTATNPAPYIDVSLMLIVAARKVLVVLLHCFLVRLAVTAFSVGKIRTAPSCARDALAFWAAPLHLHQKSPHGVPERTRRKQRHRRVAIQASIDGHSIDDRDPCVMTRTTFRHWETDLMLGGCRGKEALLAIAERKSRFLCLRTVKDKKSSSVVEALHSIQEEFGASFEELFETITTNNGTEFSRLPELFRLPQISYHLIIDNKIQSR